MWQQILLPLLVAVATNPHADQRMVPLVGAFGFMMEQQERLARKRKQLLHTILDDDVDPPRPPKKKAKRYWKPSYTYPTQDERPRSVHDVIDMLSDVHFKCYFRLSKEEVIPFMQHLGVEPDGPPVKCERSRYKENAGLVFLMLLYRLTAPRPLRPDAEHFFGMNKGRISR